MNTRLYRSADDRIFAGVAGGLAEYWDADPSLIRIVWALLMLFTGGIALVVYIVMAIVVPVAPMTAGPFDPAAVDPNAPSRSEARRAARAARREARAANGNSTVAIFFGAALVVFGSVLFVHEYLPQVNFDWLWPMILIGIGVLLLLAGLARGSDSGRGVGHPS